MKRIYKDIFKICIAIIFSLTITSCSTYNDISTGTESNLLSSDFIAASASLESNKLLQKKKNRLLYLLEKGKVEHVNKNFAESNRLFEEAYYLVEDRASMTGSKIGAAFTNAQSIPYAAEDFEKTTIHYYKALNFFQLGELDNAMVEAKRINIKLNRLNENYKKNKNRYDEDAFAHILQGVIYEAKGNVNDAFIAYRNAADCYIRNDNAYFGVALPDQLKKDVIRTAAMLGFVEEQRKYESLFNITYDGTKEENEAVIFWENGLGPYKDQTRISLTAVGGIGAGTFENEEYGIVVPIPVGANLGITAVAFPKYLQRDPYYKRATVITGEETIPFQLAQDFGTIAKQCLKDRMGREIKDVIIRVVTKKAASKGLGAIAGHLGGGFAKKLTSLAVDGVNAATEKADTRNWQSLPNSISYARVPVKEGENITLKLYSDIATDEIILETIPGRGIQIFNHVNFGRETGGITKSGAYAEVNTSSNTVSYDDTPINQSAYNQANNSQNTKSNAILNSVQLGGLAGKLTSSNNESEFKRQIIGIGGKATSVNGLTVLEPEFTVYDNSKKWGISISYGFGLDYTINEYEDYNRATGNLMVGISDSFGILGEYGRSTGEIFAFDSNGFNRLEPTSTSFGVGIFHKGKARKGRIAGGLKVIAGYDIEQRNFIDPFTGLVNGADSFSSIYFSFGYQVYF